LGEQVQSITLPPDLPNIGAARRFVRAQLEHDGADFDIDVALLLTTELVSNVVRHARTDLMVSVSISVESSIRVEVHDGQAATDAFRELLASPEVVVPATTFGGRGLGLVAALASRFGLSDEPGPGNGKIVWFELDRVR
jgi:anti-sigma regulatory factor (Ser/Thr protein kinase)